MDLKKLLKARVDSVCLTTYLILSISAKNLNKLGLFSSLQRKTCSSSGHTGVGYLDKESKRAVNSNTAYQKKFSA